MTITTPYQETENVAVKMNGATKMQLLHEALSRARMRRPQAGRGPEAYRPARQVAMQARQRAARELGGSL
jgi:hypothetical protein